MKINKWKVFQTIQVLLFIGVSIFLLVRSIDGSGTVNTWNVKLVSFAVWLGFYLLVLTLEYGIRFLVTIKNRR